MKKLVKILGILVFLLLVFKGTLYRSLVKYNEISIRPKKEIANELLIQEIDKELGDTKSDFKSIIKLAERITTRNLSFTASNVSSDPNKLITSKKANCVGYSSMFNTIINCIIDRLNLRGEIEATHKVGQLDVFGVDIHPFFDSPFFKDHDYNVILNKTTGEEIAIDLTVSDYLWISRVSQSQ